MAIYTNFVQCAREKTGKTVLYLHRIVEMCTNGSLLLVYKACMHGAFVRPPFSNKAKLVIIWKELRGACRGVG